MPNSKKTVLTATSKHLAAVAISLAGVISTANAAPVIYYGENLNPGGVVSGAPVTARASFLAGLNGVGNENFEGFAAGTTPPLALTFPGSAGNITATITSASGGVCDTSSNTVGGIGCNGFGRFPTSGVNWYHSTDTFTITFSSAIAAFGFYATDISDFNGQVTLALEKEGGGTVNLVVPISNAPNGSLLFYGFIDGVDSYTSITFGDTASGSDVFGFDDMVIGDQRQVGAVPEPETYAMMLAGLGLLGFAARRRKQQAA